MLHLVFLATLRWLQCSCTMALKRVRSQSPAMANNHRMKDRSTGTIRQSPCLLASGRAPSVSSNGPNPTSLPSNLGNINHQIITQNLTLQIPLIHVCPTCGGLDARSDLHGATGQHLPFTMTNGSRDLR